MEEKSEKSLRELTDALTMRDQQLIESEETFRTLFTINPVPMCLTSTIDGRFIKINKAFEDLSGFLEAEVLGKSALELEFYQTPIDRKQITDFYARFYNSSKVKMVVSGNISNDFMDILNDFFGGTDWNKQADAFQKKIPFIKHKSGKIIEERDDAVQSAISIGRV